MFDAIRSHDEIIGGKKSIIECNRTVAIDRLISDKLYNRIQMLLSTIHNIVSTSCKQHTRTREARIRDAEHVCVQNTINSLNVNERCTSDGDSRNRNNVLIDTESIIWYFDITLTDL